MTMFRDFSSFEIEDFAFDESFQKWVTDINSDHRDFWERYMREHPYQVDKMLAAREMVVELNRQQAGNQDQEMADKIWVNVRKHIYNRERTVRGRFKWVYAAAAVVLLVVTGYLVFRAGPTALPAQSDSIATNKGVGGSAIIEHVNHQNNVMTIDLEDGSTVKLEKDSRLTYSEGFSVGNRVVHLTGEAFFDIRKDPRHPFVIFANKTVVKVLGTSFRVQANDQSEKVVVSVKSGKVSVFERKDFEKARNNPQLSGLVLMPNQQAEFSNELEKFSKMIVPDPLLIGNTSKKEFDFDRTPLPKVFETLEKAYGIEIIYDRDLVQGRLLKVSLEDETLYEKLDLICQTMGLTYHIIDARIIIETH